MSAMTLEQVKSIVSDIADWKLPSTGETWPSGTSVSYEANFGSLGVRDYMRAQATKAIFALDAHLTAHAQMMEKVRGVIESMEYGREHRAMKGEPGCYGAWIDELKSAIGDAK